MAELKNNFTWSISARQDFEECPRRRFWAKYAMWNGWKETASPLQRAAYRLCKMENRFSVQGNAVEQAVLFTLRQAQQGQTVTVDQAYEHVKAFLNTCWNESKKKLWQVNPKKHCCLHEHYYPQHHHTAEADMTARMIAQIKLCIANFMDKALPGLIAIKPQQEIGIATVAVGDPESFILDDVKIYAIPDYAYRQDADLHIHDWKSGSRKDVHRDQMAIYGLWAHLKHGAPPGRIHVHLEYLPAGVTDSRTLQEADLQAAREQIRTSVADMSAYLVNGDIRKNEPLPQADWELSADHGVYEKCNFYELCEKELGQ